ncbi:hypothetical protein IH785_19670, partial [candidate division KSB1 bacterium]|nr:hypothetical protein [candidate division KSB1 bacterium]
MILFLCYAGVLVLFLGLGYFVLKERGRNWFWPNDVHAGHYRHLTVFYLLLSVLFFVGVFTSESVEILFMSFLLPVIGIVLTYLKMKRGYILMTWKRALLYFLVSLTLIVLLLTWQQMFEPELKTFILSAGLVLTGLFFFSARISRFFDRKKTPTFQAGYVLAAVAFLTLISILPTIAYFKIAYDLELELFIKNRQLKFAQSLEERASRVQAKYINGQFPDLEHCVDRRLKETLDIYLPKEIQMGATDTNRTDTTSNLNDSWGKKLKQQLVKIRPLYNQRSVETRQLIHDESANRLWKWEKGDSSATLSFVKQRYRGNEELALSSVLPVFSFPRTPSWWIGIFAILAVLFALIRFISRRLFLLDLHTAYTLFTRELSSSSISHNVLVLGPPSSGKSDFLKRKDFHLIDLVKIANTEHWAENFNYDRIPENKVIAIDHFEYKMENQDCNREKMLLLENLKYAHKKKVVVASTLDPTNYQYYHGNGNHSSNGTSYEETAVKINDRWAEVWSSYLRIYIEDEGDSKAFSEIVTKFQSKMIPPENSGQKNIKKKERKRLLKLFDVLIDECSPTLNLQAIGKETVHPEGFIRFNVNQLVNQIMEWAENYYKAIWDTCSKDEKLTLINLARDGFISPKNDGVIRQLLRRHLIIQTPAIKVMNESYKRFVLQNQKSDEMIAWEKEGETSGWGKLRKPLLIVLFGVVLFLFGTQQELFKSTLAFVSATAALLPALI